MPTTTPQRIGLLSAAHLANFGDVLLRDLVAAEARAVGLEPVPILPMERPTVRDMLGGLRTAWSVPALVFAGGGYLNGVDARAVARLLRFVLPALTARARRHPVGLFGVGAGPLENPMARSLARLVTDQSTCTWVRDRDSLLSIFGSRQPGLNIHVGADLALALREDELPAVPREPNGHARVGLHLALPSGNRHIASNVLRRLGEVAGSQEVTFVVFSDHDDVPAEYVAAAQLASADIEIVRWSSDWRETFATIATMRSIVSTKLHVPIVATRLGIPAFSIAKHEKTERFFRQIGRQDRWRPFTPDVDEILAGSVAIAVEAAQRARFDEAIDATRRTAEAANATRRALRSYLERVATNG